MSRRLWILAMGALALTWFQDDLRAGVLVFVSLHAIIAVCCGLSAVALKRSQLALVRVRGIMLLSLLCWTLVAAWSYLRFGDQDFTWANAVAGGLGLALIPVSTAAIISTLGASATWTAIQVSTVAFGAAPISTFIGLVLAMLVTGDSL